ncbi:MAG: chromosome partitioning protein ParB [Rhodobacteraceae bacterium HLUCCA12]|nr:MAG: chromosome partitioning protein ParB [Rhodobacteraceae bacterium HLUCCA12]
MTERKNERRGLGRGLSALMAEVGADTSFADGSVAQDDPAERLGVRSVPIEQLRANPNQPRRHFDADRMAELVESIREKGIIQPLIVRPYDGQEAHFEIVAGERRWRAAQAARLHEIPVIVKEFSDSEVLEIAIVENIQRADLSPIEEAQGYKALMDRFGHTQERISEALGKSRSYIANLLRLLTLPEEVREMLASGALSVGHARALITAPDPVALARKVIQGGLSVRQTEALARKVHTPRQKTESHGSGGKDSDTRVLEEDLSANLGMSVVIDHRTGGEGHVTIRYKTLEQLDQLCQLLSQVR